MRAYEIVEIAALVARHGPTLVETPAAIPTTAMDQYWMAAKCRLDRWMQAIKRFRDGGSKSDPLDGTGRASGTSGGSNEGMGRTNGTRGWSVLRATTEEILVADVLARVWGALAAAFDRRHGTDRAEPLAGSVLAGQLEARRRALRLLVDTVCLPRVEVAALNHLRRRAERWTDFLLGGLGEAFDLAAFAVEPDRARDFALDFVEERRSAGPDAGWTLASAAMHEAFRFGLSPVMPNGDLDRQIAAAILGCFPADFFDDFGLPRSIWMHRISRACGDMEGLIAKVIGEAPQLPTPAAARFRR